MKFFYYHFHISTHVPSIYEKKLPPVFTYSHIPVTISVILVPHIRLPFFMKTIKTSFSVDTSKAKDDDEKTIMMTITITSLK